MGAPGPRILSFVSLCVLSVGLVTGCRDKGDSTYVEGLRVTESVRGGEPEKSIDELEREVTKYRGEVERTIKAAESLGTYYRMLGVAYMNRQMYGEALRNLELAIRLYPENEQLFYYGGVCAARAAKAVTDDAERLRLFALAEKYYLRTLFLLPGTRPALFGLAVIYSIELNRPAEAVPLLERLLTQDTSNTEAKTLLARTHVALGNYEEALDLYRQIAAAGVSDEIKRQTEDNIREIEGRLSGGSK
jgi:cytochrome c-type biogenesis protein CcmH/NrfG